MTALETLKPRLVYPSSMANRPEGMDFLIAAYGVGPYFVATIHGRDIYSLPFRDAGAMMVAIGEPSKKRKDQGIEFDVSLVTTRRMTNRKLELFVMPIASENSSRPLSTVTDNRVALLTEISDFEKKQGHRVFSTGDSEHVRETVRELDFLQRNV